MALQQRNIKKQDPGRTTIVIPAELHMELKLLAVRERKLLCDVVAAMLRAGMAKAKTTKAA